MLPEIEQYCGTNTIKLYMEKVTLWFSYETVIAFYTPEGGRVICENVWSKTTGQHLNAIDDNHKNRLPRDEFEEQLTAVMEGRQK